MRNLRTLLVLGGLAIPAVLVLAQVNSVETFERGLRPHVAQPKIQGGTSFSLPYRDFKLEGVEYRAGLSRSGLDSSPEWQSSQPLPIGFNRLEEIARQELGKLVTNDADWSVTGFQLQSVTTQTALKWYFVVEMRPFWEPAAPGAKVNDSFCICIDLSGRPGIIGRLAHR